MYVHAVALTPPARKLATKKPNYFANTKQNSKGLYFARDSRAQGGIV
jgi:hypothetical protein